IYTRLTATGRHEPRVACTCTATSARAWAVNATRPSIPAVARPALRCVTCRTLSSVFDQLRNISFCRFLAWARFPSRTALKILRRAISNKGELYFTCYTGSFTGPVFLAWLDRLVRHLDRKIHLIADGHPVHRRVNVRNWLAEHV